MVQEKVRQTGAGHGRENVAVVGDAVVTVAVAVGCTRRWMAAASSVVEVAAGHSSRSTPAAVLQWWGWRRLRVVAMVRRRLR